MPEKPFKDGGKDTEGGVDVFAKMGLEVFTIPQLQDALGFSYQPAYRLLHGYTNGKGTYTGILDKCPAISPIDATVGEMLAGMEIKRREKYFSFDATIYREWMKHADVWLKPDDTDGHADSDNTDNGNDGNNGNNGNNGNDENHVFTFSPRLHQKRQKVKTRITSKTMFIPLKEIEIIVYI